MPRFRWSPGTIAVLVLSVLAALIGGNVAHGRWSYRPSAPPSVCGLIRPEFSATLVPGHDAPVAAPTDEDGSRANSCRIVGGTTRLWVVLGHIGRGRPGEDPLTHAKRLLLQQFAFGNEFGPPVRLDIGDEGGYQVLDDDPDRTEVICAVRVGTYLVSADYTGAGLTVASARDALRSVAEEVLSQV